VIVICDASPIIALAAVGRLDLVRNLYGDVAVPRAVRAEVAAGPGGSELLAGTRWLIARDALRRDVVAELEIEVDSGEAEAIALALELEADLLVIDDRRGRMLAARRGIPFVGVVGVLLEARSRGLLDAVRPVLDDLRDLAVFRLSDSVRKEALRIAGESLAGD